MSLRIRRIVEVLSVAVLAVALAAIVRTVCHLAFNETIPYTPFYPAIVAATMYGRLLGGAAATVLAGFAASFWLAPFGEPMIEQPTDLIGLFLFLFVSAIVVGLCEAMRRAQLSAEKSAKEEQRALNGEQVARREAEEANRLKDQFLASTSHELRTPLQAILGWTHLLKRAGLSEEERLQGIETIDRNARLQSRLIEDLLDMSRIVAGKLRIAPRAVDPGAVAQAAIETVATASQAKQVTITFCDLTNKESVWADPDRLQQILWNLLSNSIKFSPPQTTVRVTLRQVNHTLEIEVADEGEGIETAFLPHVFERFRQADGVGAQRSGGLGLGLAIVKQLVELHGGRIRVASDGIGCGTRFTISFPTYSSQKESVPRQQAVSRGSLQGVRVLVVEDDPATCDLVARLLRECHSEVVAVTSVDLALAALDRFEPDVVVSDLSMPEKDGYELLKQLRTRKRPAERLLPAMALTARSSPEDRRRAFDAGYRLHLTKPIDAAQLTQAVAELAAP